MLGVVELEGDHWRLRFHAPAIADSSKPGQFVNVRYPGELGEPRAFDSYADVVEYHKKHPAPEPPLLLARPFGVHRADADGSVEILFKVVGRGTRMLAKAEPGTELDVLGPIGNGFDLSNPPQTAALVAGGTGLAPLYLLAQRLQQAGCEVVILVGTGFHVPMTVSDSEQAVHFLDDEVTAVIDEYVEMGASVRIATVRPRKGCYTGTAADLLAQYLDALSPRGTSDKEIFSCGPWAMQAVVAELAARFDMPCQVLLEERMGCGLGACMACVCKIRQQSGEYKNKRVCVEGPVFRAEDVGWKERK